MSDEAKPFILQREAGSPLAQHPDFRAIRKQTLALTPLVSDLINPWKARMPRKLKRGPAVFSIWDPHGDPGEFAEQIVAEFRQQIQASEVQVAVCHVNGGSLALKDVLGADRFLRALRKSRLLPQERSRLVRALLIYLAFLGYACVDWKGTPRLALERLLLKEGWMFLTTAFGVSTVTNWLTNRVVDRILAPKGVSERLAEGEKELQERLKQPGVLERFQDEATRMMRSLPATVFVIHEFRSLDRITRDTIEAYLGAIGQHPKLSADEYVEVWIFCDQAYPKERGRLQNPNAMGFAPDFLKVERQTADPSQTRIEIRRDFAYHKTQIKQAHHDSIALLALLANLSNQRLSKADLKRIIDPDIPMEAAGTVPNPFRQTKRKHVEQAAAELRRAARNKADVDGIFKVENDAIHFGYQSGDLMDSSYPWANKDRLEQGAFFLIVRLTEFSERSLSDDQFRFFSSSSVHKLITALIQYLLFDRTDWLHETFESTPGSQALFLRILEKLMLGNLLDCRFEDGRVIMGFIEHLEGEQFFTQSEAARDCWNVMALDGKPFGLAWRDVPAPVAPTILNDGIIYGLSYGRNLKSDADSLGPDGAWKNVASFLNHRIQDWVASLEKHAFTFHEEGDEREEILSRLQTSKPDLAFVLDSVLIAHSLWTVSIHCTVGRMQHLKQGFLSALRRHAHATPQGMPSYNALVEKLAAESEPELPFPIASFLPQLEKTALLLREQNNGVTPVLLNLARESIRLGIWGLIETLAANSPDSPDRQRLLRIAESAGMPAVSFTDDMPKECLQYLVQLEMIKGSPLHLLTATDLVCFLSGRFAQRVLISNELGRTDDFVKEIFECAYGSFVAQGGHGAFLAYLSLSAFSYEIYGSDNDKAEFFLTEAIKNAHDPAVHFKLGSFLLQSTLGGEAVLNARTSFVLWLREHPDFHQPFCDARAPQLLEDQENVALIILLGNLEAHSPLARQALVEILSRDTSHRFAQLLEQWERLSNIPTPPTPELIATAVEDLGEHNYICGLFLLNSLEKLDDSERSGWFLIPVRKYLLSLEDYRQTNVAELLIRKLARFLVNDTKEHRQVYIKILENLEDIYLHDHPRGGTELFRLICQFEGEAPTENYTKLQDYLARSLDYFLDQELATFVINNRWLHILQYILDILQTFHLFGRYVPREGSTQASDLMFDPQEQALLMRQDVYESIFSASPSEHPAENVSNQAKAACASFAWILHQDTDFRDALLRHALFNRMERLVSAFSETL